jgi:DNA-binding transcriptional ArsR family regulator
MANLPKLLWEWGTAYDMFISLAVLHEPADFGVRGSWASSVRKRLPPKDREILETSLHLIHIPFHWIHQLPTPKDSITVLYTLGQIPATERLSQLSLFGEACEIETILNDVTSRGFWNEKDQEKLFQAFSCEDQKKSPSKKKIANMLDWWSRAGEFGERYLNAMKTYQEVFFSEEEKRIRPALKSALDRAQSLAKHLELPDLVEELSQGLRFEELPSTKEIVLAPSYWVTPLMYFGSTGSDRWIWLFGARPANESLVPGEVVPDAMLRALKALSDPTRLRILHYLTEEPLSPAELARRLRLRPPTVTHHLQALRLAGLVQVNVGAAGKEKKSFATRTEAVKATCSALETFLIQGTTSNPDEIGK